VCNGDFWPTNWQRDNEQYKIKDTQLRVINIKKELKRYASPGMKDISIRAFKNLQVCN